MQTIIKKEEYMNIPYVVHPKLRALVWKQSAGLLKGRIKNVKKKLADLRKEWDRF
ncbi:MAG: hypothetical protein AAB861_02830 [Patescibacteria group bacterium]